MFATSNIDIDSHSICSDPIMDFDVHIKYMFLMDNRFRYNLIRSIFSCLIFYVFITQNIFIHVLQSPSSVASALVSVTI